MHGSRFEAAICAHIRRVLNSPSQCHPHQGIESGHTNTGDLSIRAKSNSRAGISSESPVRIRGGSKHRLSKIQKLNHEPKQLPAVGRSPWTKSPAPNERPKHIQIAMKRAFPLRNPSSTPHNSVLAIHIKGLNYLFLVPNSTNIHPGTETVQMQQVELSLKSRTEKWLQFLKPLPKITLQIQPSTIIQHESSWQAIFDHFMSSKIGLTVV